MDTVLPSLFLQVILIASNAFFAMSEFAVVSVNTQKMKRLAEGGSKPAARLLVITEAPSDFLATIQVGVTLSGFLASAAAAGQLRGPIGLRAVVHSHSRVYAARRDGVSHYHYSFLFHADFRRACAQAHRYEKSGRRGRSRSWASYGR